MGQAAPPATPHEFGRPRAKLFGNSQHQGDRVLADREDPKIVRRTRNQNAVLGGSVEVDAVDTNAVFLDVPQFRKRLHHAPGDAGAACPHQGDTDMCRAISSSSVKRLNGISQSALPKMTLTPRSRSQSSEAPVGS